MIWAGDQFLPDFTYDIRNTPCENISQKSICIYADNVFGLFPEDVWLKDAGIQSNWQSPLSTHPENISEMGVMDTI